MKSISGLSEESQPLRQTESAGALHAVSHASMRSDQTDVSELCYDLNYTPEYRAGQSDEKNIVGFPDPFLRIIFVIT